MILMFICSPLGQSQEKSSNKKIKLRPELSFEYFNRTISWDEEKYSSKLQSFFTTLTGELEVKNGVFISGILGYSLSNFDSLAFRKLPFSVELDVGGIEGYIIGGEVKINCFSVKEFEIKGQGQIVYSFGSYEEWPIKGLNVEGGIVTGKPFWVRAMIGPVITYNKYDKFFPYLFIHFNKLWGTFQMEEKIKDLNGKENKKIKGKSNFGASLGSIYQLLNFLSVNAEATFLPYSGGLDLGFTASVSLTF